MIRSVRDSIKTLTPLATCLALLTLTTLGCGPSPVMATYVGDDWTESFMQADFNRFFRVHVPERSELGPAAPLVLAFHGVGQNGEQFQAQSGLDQVAAAEGFIVVYLEAAMGAWDVFDDMQFLGLDELAYVREVIDRVERRYVVDRNRIIAVGLSNGGVISQRLACDLSHRIAGFVSVAATMPRRLAEDCHPDNPISALYIIGTADPFFPVAGGSVLLPVDSVMDVWASANRCEGRRQRSEWPDRTEDGTRVYWSRYGACRNDTRVWMDSIVGGGHAWPDAAVPASTAFGPTSHDISANQEIARFLAALPRE